MTAKPSPKTQKTIEWINDTCYGGSFKEFQTRVAEWMVEDRMKKVRERLDKHLDEYFYGVSNIPIDEDVLDYWYKAEAALIFVQDYLPDLLPYLVLKQHEDPETQDWHECIFEKMASISKACHTEGLSR